MTQGTKGGTLRRDLRGYLGVIKKTKGFFCRGPSLCPVNDRGLVGLR